MVIVVVVVVCVCVRVCASFLEFHLRDEEKKIFILNFFFLFLFHLVERESGEGGGDGSMVRWRRKGFIRRGARRKGKSEWVNKNVEVIGTSGSCRLYIVSLVIVYLVSTCFIRIFISLVHVLTRISTCECFNFHFVMVLRKRSCVFVFVLFSLVQV